MRSEEAVALAEQYHWIVDETPTISVFEDELPTRPAERGRAVNREIYLGTVVLDGVERRVFRLGAYGRIEGVTQGLPLDGLRLRLPESEREKIEWSVRRRNRVLVDVPSLPLVDAEDRVRIRMKCTGPGGCRLLVGLPTGRVRAEGPAREELVVQALEWVVSRPETDPQEPRYVWRFEPEYESSEATIDSIALHLDQLTGPRGRDLAIERQRIMRAMARFDGEDE